MKNKKELTFIDLFAGIGGFRIALESLGLKCILSSEIDKHCQTVYKDNFGELPYGDIREIDANDIPDFDILTAGFPCQPFSYAGNKEGFNDKIRGTLFFEIARILEAKKPKMFILENVKGITSHDKGKTLKVILDTISELNYKCKWKVINSYDFGLPQKRERWYCIGFRDDLNFEFPTGKGIQSTLKDIIDFETKDNTLTLTDFEIDRINHHFNSSEIRVKHDNSKYEKNTKKGRHGIYSYMKPDKTLRFHVGDIAKSQIQEAYYCSIDSIAPAIIATREPKMWDLKRRLSVLECKRLQGFPENFRFSVSDKQAKKQLGNSISIPVVTEISRNLISSYNNLNELE